ncbi:MFS transporter [Isoalcanivorax beigongshangi]|uniref:MFS transporter n=1 Tax=Isoalcanivorax beigongshangi TaxID=3238810 RepID=A0ABV4ADT1_9GAMM
MLSLRRLDHPSWMILGILLIAANLRAPVTGIAPLVTMIQDSLGLSAAAAGLLTSSPLAVFAVVSLLASRVAQRFGLERALMYALWALVIGIALRSLPSVTLLFGGNLLAAVGIALGNVLLPSLIKRDFPHQIVTLTGWYALTMGLAAGLTSAVAVPLAHLPGLDWRHALAVTGIVATLSALVWFPQSRRPRPAAPTASSAKPVSLWRSALAWQVTLFLGLNSLMYYIVISWLPAIMQGSGFTATAAGNAHGLMQLASALAGPAVVPLMRYFKDQRIPVVILTSCNVIGLLGLWLWPQTALVSSALVGFGAGAVLVMALAFVGMRVSTPAQAAGLSGMAQCVGYLMAAFGPTFTGKLYDWQGSWHSTLVLCVVLTLLMGTAGVLAARDRKVDDRN